MIGFPLGESMKDCPIYWANFIRSLQDFPYRDARMEVIQEALADYGARYYVAEDHEPGDFIVFESGEMLTWFIMRWS